MFLIRRRYRFNTQPPEGGWSEQDSGGLLRLVSTHSRPKAAGAASILVLPCSIVSTHSRPKAAGVLAVFAFSPSPVSTHSRPKAAGNKMPKMNHAILSFNTQPPEGGWVTATGSTMCAPKFQHTAARRRLGPPMYALCQATGFQHTAARRRLEPLSKALLHQVSQPRFR